MQRRTALKLAASTVAGTLAPGLASRAFAGQPLKAAWVYVAPVGDVGWSYSHDLGRRAVAKIFGSRLQTSFVENVPEGPQGEHVFRDLAMAGNQVIFATSFGYMDPVVKVARDFPHVLFEQATGYKVAPNVGEYDVRTYEGAYMAGVVAGRMTKSNKLGFVATFPIPEVHPVTRHTFPDMLPVVMVFLLRPSSRGLSRANRPPAGQLAPEATAPGHARFPFPVLAGRVWTFRYT